jgi:hypothetical protein
MVDSFDDLPDELLDATRKAKEEFGFNKKQERALDYIRKNIPISGIADILTEDLWLREVLKDVDSPNPSTRSKALEMVGKFIGALGGKGAKAGPRKLVEFE